MTVFDASDPFLLDANYQPGMTRLDRLKAEQKTAIANELIQEALRQQRPISDALDYLESLGLDGYAWLDSALANIETVMSGRRYVTNESGLFLPSNYQ